MKHIIIIYRTLLSSLLCCLAAMSACGDELSPHITPILSKYCVSCHGEEEEKGGVKMDHITTLNSALRNHRLLENIIEQVRTEEMPPVDGDLFPTSEEREKLIKELTVILKRIKTGDVPTKAGKTLLRRLNKTEYNYTVRDLFGVKFDPGKDFPADGAGGEGFDNTADSLFTSPQLSEKYLVAANKVVKAVYRDRELKKRVIFVRPRGSKDAVATAKKVLEHHATFAYRRRVTEDDLAPLLSAFQKDISTGMTYEEALRRPLTALLMNPRFLFRAEHDQPGKKEWKLNNFEIATRLSYFIWSTMPDKELFRVADQGLLHDPKVLRQQTLRMLADPKAVALAHHFGGQWLGYTKMIDEVSPDKKRFPTFDNGLRRSMYYEAVKFISYIIKENRPITELIDSDYTFANNRLVEHYGLKEEVTGKELVKVKLENKNRGGVFGLGAILTSTSLPLRTSPVHRGTWILDSILGDPPPPPPADAGELPDDDTHAEGLTFREQLAIHRKSDSCASCHATIDPLGFGLENFDAIGRWREVDNNGKKVDTTAILPGGITFSSAYDLKKLILEQGLEKISKNIVRKMISYATGRSLEYYDEVVVNEIVDNLSKKDYKMHELLIGVVNSRAFLYRSESR